MQPFIVSITGAYSGCGKTFIAEAVIKGIPIKWGAIKYTRTSLYSSISDDTATIEREGKDTDRLKSAGADKVLWLRSPKNALYDVLQTAREKLSGCEAIIVEGNSPADILNPAFLIFVFGDDPTRVKPSAMRLIERADCLLYKQGAPVKTSAKMYNKYSESGIKEMINDILKKFGLNRHAQ